MSSNTGRTNNQGLKEAGKIMVAVSVEMIMPLGVMFSHWPSLLHPFFIGQIEGDVKEPTLLFGNSRGCFPSSVFYLAHFIHIMGRVSYNKLINGPIVAASSPIICWYPSIPLTC